MKGGRKTVYFDGKLKYCAGCKTKVSIESFDQSGNAQEPDQSGFYKSRCKPCVSLYNNNKQQEQRYKKNPDNYWICECHSIISKVYRYCYRCRKPKSVSF